MNNPFEPLRRLGQHALLVRIALSISIVLMLATSMAWGCGMEFPSSVLLYDRDVLWSPRGDFGVELDRIQFENDQAAVVYKAALPESDDGRAGQTQAVGLAELQTVLKARGDTAQQQQQAINTWRAYRKGLDHWREKATKRELIDNDLTPLHIQPGPDLPGLDGLPTEFALYLRGAAAYIIRDMPEARSQWSKLLALPADQRHYRSTWAAYMTGRSYLNLQESQPTQPDHSNQAIAWFKRTRQLTADGFADGTGLASASLGWEARVQLNLRHEHQAIKLYLAQWHSGDKRLQESIAVAIYQAIAKKEKELGYKAQLEAIAKDRTTQQAVTAWFVADGGRDSYRRWPNDEKRLLWLAIMEKVDSKNAVGTDRLAWMAYQTGEYDAAARWLERAPKDAPIALWISARLLMRQGKREQAIVQLVKVVHSFPDREIWPETSWRSRVTGLVGTVRPKAQASAELGVLRLSQGQFVDALDALLDANDWMDAAYVAQSVLNIDELKKYVDHLKPGLRIATPLTVDFGQTKDINGALVGLLARRLTRLGRFAEARTYFKPEMQVVLDQYTHQLGLAQDASQSKTVRAEAYWEAAILCRYRGLGLMGTEMGPDYAIFRGQFQFDLVHIRMDITSQSDLDRYPDGGPKFPPTDEEFDRYKRHLPVPNKRWHYRYKALDMAWSALALMPDESDLTARRFIIAGSWVKARDPKAADRFYKALVNRCGHTKLGRQADKLRWFPPLPEVSKLQ